jgi:hypothetical protein
MTLAKLAYSIAAGKTTTVILKLGSQARRLLSASGGRLPATLAIQETSPAPAKTQSDPVRLSLQRAARRRH